MPGSPRSTLVLQILCGLAVGAAIAWCWINSEVPLWEAPSPDGPYYAPGWRTAVVCLLLLVASQWLSFFIFRRIKQTTLLGGFGRRQQVLTGLVTILALVLIGIGWVHSAGLRGQIIAHIDLANGHARLLGFGLPPPWRSDYARLLRERHGIEFRVVAGCIVSRPLMAYVEGYNQVSMSGAKRKWGRDVFGECLTDAQKNTPTVRAVQ